MSGPPELPYVRVARDLAARIAAGEWQPGERMPSIGELTAHYGVSRATVVKAIKTLVNDGQVVTLAGYGTFRAGSSTTGSSLAASSTTAARPRQLVSEPESVSKARARPGACAWVARPRPGRQRRFEAR